MTPPHLLLIEDDEFTLPTLVDMFREEWPDVQIDAAPTVEAGLALIHAASDKQMAYDVAILDFKLPAQQGLNAEIDVKVCHAIVNRSPRTPIVHITGFAEDPIVIDHIARIHPTHAARGLLISKREVNWVIKLVEKTREAVYAARVEAAYDQLFNEGSGASRTASLGVRLRHLCDDVSTCWVYLDERLRDKLRTHLHVDDTDPTSICVNLL
jgi:DNA-binding NarL/FixJ family response regulator